MNKTLKKLIILNIVLLGVVGAFFVSSIIMMNYDIKCFIASHLHIYCPGCGGTRSLFSLLKLDIISSLKYNITVPCMLFVYLYYNIRAIISIRSGREDFFEKEKFYFVYILVAVILINFALKNILLWGFGIDIIGDFIS